MAQRLNKEELIQLADNILHPKGRGFTSEQINQQLLLFCVNCPDPVGAMNLVVEDQRAFTAGQLVDAAFALTPRDVIQVPQSELRPTHPLRRMTLDP